MSMISQKDDFQNLEDITLGDYPIEIELLEIFMSTSEESLLSLQEAIMSDPEVWRSLCHSFKGACFNIGANQLGTLVESLMKEKNAEPPAKNDRLVIVARHYDLLKSRILERIETLKKTLSNKQS